jgi:ribulose-phosphate 3-epimerase
MVEIVPTIIAQNIKEVEEKIRLVEQYVSWVQLDIMDGRFVEARTWNNPKELSSIETRLNLEADLMVLDPVIAVTSWLESKVERIFVQKEAFGGTNPDIEIRETVERIHGEGKEAGLTLNVETPVAEVFPWLKVIDWVLLRGGTPGSYGQPFQEIVFGKIRMLKSRDSLIRIMVDGGVRLDLVSSLKEAGVNALAVGSAIFRAPDIKVAIEAFKKEAE